MFVHLATMCDRLSCVSLTLNLSIGCSQRSSLGCDVQVSSNAIADSR
ncbi:hypothetical protein [Nostoc sp. DSM 114160]